MPATWCKLACCLLLVLGLTACSDRKSAGMSEKEQLRYDNAAKSLQDISDEARADGSDGDACSRLHAKLRRLDYDFNAEGMGVEAQAKCQRLKERIEAAKRNPDDFLQGQGVKAGAKRARVTALVSKRAVGLDELRRYPVCLFAGEAVGLQLDCTGPVSATLYDAGRQTIVRQYKVDARLCDDIPVKADGIYVLELKAANRSVQASLRLTVSGADGKRRPYVREQLTKCKKNDFLATATTEVEVRKVFREPKKVALRANLKAMFSGKPRALVAVTVPNDCETMVYSLRISTNENTVPSDGKFADNLETASTRVKLFGLNVYEKQSLGSRLVGQLLFDTRPPREEDAFCNLYVITDAAHARRFQDTNAPSAKFGYDVDQSQIGTQSCTGELRPKGHKTLYLGFENERLRYDNYIWLEVAALTHTTSYVRPVYAAR